MTNIDNLNENINNDLIKSNPYYDVFRFFVTFYEIERCINEHNKTKYNEINYDEIDYGNDDCDEIEFDEIEYNKKCCNQNVSGENNIDFISKYYLHYLGNKHIDDFFDYIENKTDYDIHKEEILNFIIKEPFFNILKISIITTLYPEELNLNIIMEEFEKLNSNKELNSNDFSNFILNKINNHTEEFNLNEISNNTKNELFQKILGDLVFSMLYSSIFSTVLSDTCDRYPNFFPLKKLGNKYIDYINESPDEINDRNYILVKCLMLKDFLNIYNNYESDPSLIFINIDDVKNNLKIFEEKLLLLN